MSFSRRGKALGLFLSTLLLLPGVFAYAPSAQAEGGILYFSPSTGQKEVGSTFSVAIRVNTSGNVINAAEGSIVFDPSKLEVRSLSKSGSFFTLWTTEPKFSNSEGTIEFGGGLPTPGFSGANGLILTINFRAKGATTSRGSTDVVLVSGDILANDGNGTNILSSLGKATFYISPSGIPEEETTILPNETSGTPIMAIKSKTHPDPAKWYSNKNPEFNWNVPEGVSEVRLVLGTKATSLPRVVYSPPISEKKIDDIDDGVWYLNGQFRTADGLGDVASFRFNVDTKAPNQFTITRLDNDLTNPQPELLFSTTDATSGIDRYEAKIGDGEWFIIDRGLAGKPYKVPLQPPGNKKMIIKAFDLAGNHVDPEIDLVIKPLDAPTIDSAPTEVKAKETFKVSGKSKPALNVDVYATLTKDSVYAPTNTSNDDKYKLTSVAVDENGLWTAEVSLEKGRYNMYAYARDARGALSNVSNVVVISSISGILSKFFGFLFDNNWWFILALILYVILITLLVHYISSRIPGPGKGEKKVFAAELPREYKKVVDKLSSLFTDVERELDLLSKISSHRSLYPEEKHLKSKFGHYHKILKGIMPTRKPKKIAD